MTTDFKTHPVFIPHSELERRAKIATRWCAVGVVLGKTPGKLFCGMITANVALDIHKMAVPWFQPYAFQSSASNTIVLIASALITSLGAGAAAYFGAGRLGRYGSKKAEVIRKGILKHMKRETEWCEYSHRLNVRVRDNIRETKMALRSKADAKNGTYKIPLMRCYGNKSSIQEAAAYDKLIGRTAYEKGPRTEWNFTRQGWKEYSQQTRICDRLVSTSARQSMHPDLSGPELRIQGFPHALIGQIMRALG